MNPALVSKSKFLSLVLRHRPDKIGLTLDSAGWADVEDLLARCVTHRNPITREELAEVVATNEKKRFALSDDGRRIRANQGHSVEVELDLPRIAPPETLFHGTADRFLASIRHEGLIKGNRHHVHLSAVRETAAEVGKRHGRPVVLQVAAGEMHRAGHAFFRSENGVWLTDAVPAKFLREE